MTHVYLRQRTSIRSFFVAALALSCVVGLATKVHAQESWNWDMVLRGTGGAVGSVADTWIAPTFSQTALIDGLYYPNSSVENSFTREILITDSYRSRVLRFDNVTGAYKGEVGPGAFTTPYGLAIDAVGNIVVTDQGLSKVLAFDSTGTSPVAINWDFSWDPATLTHRSGFNQPWSVAFTPGSFIGDGNPASRILIVDNGNNRVLTFGTDGRFISTFGTFGSSSPAAPARGQFDGPMDLALRPVSGIDPKTGLTYTYPYQVYIADAANNRVQVLKPDGTWIAEIAGLAYPEGVTIDANGRVLIAETFRNRIAVFSAYPNFVPVSVEIGFPSRGTPELQINCDPGSPDFAVIPVTLEYQPNQCAPGSLQGPTHIALDSVGRLLVTDNANWRMERFNHPPITVTAAAASSSVPAGSPITLSVVVSAASGSFLNVSLSPATVTTACRNLSGPLPNCNGVLNGTPSISPAAGTVTQGSPLTFTLTYPTSTLAADSSVTFTATVSNGTVSATSQPSDPVRIGFTGTSLKSTVTFSYPVPATGWWVITPPTITLTATGTPAADEIDWALTGDGTIPPLAPESVTVCPGAGPCNVPLASEVSLFLWYRAINTGEHETWHVVPVKFELTGPGISIVSQPTPCPTCAGWLNANAVTTYALASSISGNKTITPVPAVVGGVTLYELTASGEGSLVSSPMVTVTDNAGLTATAGPFTFKIDKTKPTIATNPTRTPATNGVWNRTDVTVTFTATDRRPGGVDLQSGFPLSLSASATPFSGDPNGKWVMVFSTEGAGQSAVAGPGTFIDLAGNPASNTVTVSNINIDKTAPVVTATFSQVLPASGWFNATTPLPITLTFSATDALSGISATTQSVSVTAQGSQSVTRTFTDVAGNSADKIVTFKVDTVPPTLTAPLIVGPSGIVANGFGFFDLTGLPATTGVTVNVTAADATSGVQTVCYDLTGGSTCTPATAAGAGVFSITVLSTTTTARAWVLDNAGNQSAFQSFSVKIARTAPIATGNNLSTQQNQAVSGVLTSTGAATGATLTYAISAQPAHGTVVLTPSSGAFTYTPTTNYNGADSFKFTVSDGSVVSQPATIAISIAAVNQPPVASNLAISVVVGGSVSGQIIAADVDSTSLTYSVLVGPTRGNVTLTAATGAFTYTSTGNDLTPDSFRVRVSDGFLTSDATVSVTIKPTNQDPNCSAAASPGQLWPPNHRWVTIAITGVTDPDGDPVSLKIGSISQDEPTMVEGSGNTPTDGRILDNGTVAQVRAERSGLRDGRVYEIFFTASDTKGGSCTGSVTVEVPHDQSGRPAVDSRVRYNSLVPNQ